MSEVHAKDCTCYEPECDLPAVAFWPVIDPDIPSRPWCREHLDERKNALMVMLHEDGLI